MASCKIVFSFLLLVAVTGHFCEAQTRCIGSKLTASKLSTDVTENRLPVVYVCPREYDPKTFTKCCGNEGCCKGPYISKAQNDNWILMITAILVICTCAILTILVLVCCFWSTCPMYSSCAANYSSNNVIAYSLDKEDPCPLMPAEDTKAQYHPCTVKIKTMEEV